MVTRDARIAHFTCDRPPDLGAMAEVLCEDHVGTYALPFPCRWTEGGWASAATGRALDATVIGWRPMPARREGRARRPSAGEFEVR